MACLHFAEQTGADTVVIIWARTRRGRTQDTTRVRWRGRGNEYAQHGIVEAAAEEMAANLESIEEEDEEEDKGD